MQHNPRTWDGKAPIGRFLAAMRSRLGLSQSELARRLGVSAPNLSRIENGTDLRVSTLVAVAHALELEAILVPEEHAATVRAFLDVLDRPATTTTEREPHDTER
jgi:transcriptional regulator with XRE-family HTH domain